MKRNVLISVGVVLFVVALVMIAHMTGGGGFWKMIHGGG